MRTIATALILVLLAGGCATIFSGTDEDISFDSEPAGANIRIDGIVVGTTPATVEVDRPGFEEQEVTVELEGYDARTFELDKEFNTVAILNILFWPGFIVDALTGALYKYDKDAYTVNFDTGNVTLMLDELPRGESGEYVIPSTVQPVRVIDTETGATLIFK